MLYHIDNVVDSEEDGRFWACFQGIVKISPRKILGNILVVRLRDLQSHCFLLDQKATCGRR
jgi:hypothetical protein